MSRGVVRSGAAWRFPAAGFAASAFLAVAPGSPMAAAGWPLRGPFGAFTWTACFVSTGLCLTLLFLSVAPARRARAPRVALAALAFGLLALGAYAAAARADRIVQSPLVALVFVLAVLLVLRAVAGRLAAADPDPEPITRPPEVKVKVKPPGGLRAALTGLALAAALGIAAAAALALAGGLAKLAPAPAGRHVLSPTHRNDPPVVPTGRDRAARGNHRAGGG